MHSKVLFPLLSVGIATARLLAAHSQLLPEATQKPEPKPISALQPGEARENAKDGLKYVWIPPGTFLMGCSPGDNDCSKREMPAHQVTITKGFWIGQTKVTVGAYQRFAAATGRQMPAAPTFKSSWNNQEMPIGHVSWDDAQAYCARIGGRVPTEAEWEYAARAGSAEARYGPLDEIAWYADNSGRQRLDSAKIWKEDMENYGNRLKENDNGPHPVGQKRANAFGLYDMLGNEWEWVNDWFDGNYYQNIPSSDPQGPASGQLRVLRGGSWMNYPQLVRASFRRVFDPGYRYDGGGLRCAADAVVAP